MTTAVKPVPTPVRGPLFRQVCALGVKQIGGHKRAKLLALLAAFADAGETSPSARVLVHKLGLGGGRRSFRAFDALVAALERDGWLTVARGDGRQLRNRYTLRLDGRRS